MDPTCRWTPTPASPPPSLARLPTGSADRNESNWMLAPAIGYGASGEHEGFPGTVSIGTSALRLLLVEFGRSASQWASRLVFVNGHGGNVEALAAAVALLRYEGRDVRLVFVHRRRTPTRTPATPKRLYCYIFRRPTCGSMSASPATARRWRS